MAIVFNVSSEIGDIIRIKTEYPVVGISALQSFVDDTVGETGSIFYNKSFRYSLNGGIHFTDFEDLTTLNLQNVPITNKSQFVIDYRYTHAGSEPTSDLTFNNVELGGDYESLEYPIYNRNVFKKFFDVNDVNVLGWAINVLEKLYEKGIVPEYIERNSGGTNLSEIDADFLTLFNTTTHFFAIIVYYARQFEKISENEILLPKFIDNLGLFTNINITTTHLQYLFNNYPDEFRKRGTNKVSEILNDDDIPNGEVLRLISYTEPSEFMFALLEPHATGWCLSKSSPSFNYTRHCQNMIKGYEADYGFEDLINYPISKASLVSIVSNEMVVGANVTLNEKAGIYPENTTTIENQWVRVDKSIGYEIVVRVNQDGFNNQLNFGVLGYDSDKNELTMKSQEDDSSTNVFFEANRLPQETEDYTVRGMIFPEYVNKAALGATTDQMLLDIGYGYHMRFHESNNVQYIVPTFYCENISGSSEIRIKDFKVKPLNFNFTLGKLGVKNIIYMLYQNNSIYNQQTIYNNVKDKLVSYDNELIDNNYNPPISNSINNGYLYNWFAVENALFTPVDWIIPDQADWGTLLTTLGGESVAGGEMKESGLEHWNTPNIGATNSSGLTAFGSGRRNSDGSFIKINQQAVFGTSEEYPFTSVENYILMILNDGVAAYPITAIKKTGTSYRLLWDGAGVPPTTIIDYDGNIYNVVQIGTQYWLQSNWKCTHLRDGTPLEKITDNTEWSNATTSDLYYCAYGNDESRV